MQWETVIGLEVHVQLSTKSKIFSGSSTAFGASPNTQASAVDLALPGVLPVMNKGAVERAIKLGLALGAKINTTSIFARKNYFYPDLPKGYQISQFEIPIVAGGGLAIRVGDQEKFVNITRAHLEEDAGKSTHDGLGDEMMGRTGIDLNRAGTPLLEVVSEPEMSSSLEAVAYAKKLHELVTWLDLCDGNMQEGSFRVDANVSVRPRGQKEFGTRCEIKNLNSFRFMERAIEYEIARQIELIEDGGKVVQQTRLYDADRNETRAMRSKEDAMDYRYFPDPDLPPLVISEAWIAELARTMPELPGAMAERLVSQYALPKADALQLTSDKAIATYFEAAVAQGADAKLAANWVMGEVAKRLNEAELGIGASPVNPNQLAELIQRISDGTISGKIAKDVFAALWDQEFTSADAVIAAKGLKQISDSGAIVAIVDAVLADNALLVEEFKAGKEKAFNALVGQIMKASKGKANPQQVNEILRGKLG